MEVSPSITGDTLDEFGIVYVATGEKYIQEAKKSSKSVQDYGIKTCIFSDSKNVNKESFSYSYYMDSATGGFLDKIAPMKKSPFEKSIFLDTDTLVVGNLNCLYYILDKYDIAYCNAPIRKNGRYISEKVPNCFVQPNTGVIAYVKNKKTDELFDLWLENYKKHIEKINPKPNDQEAFRESVWEIDIKNYILPPEYNLRTKFDYFIGGRSSVKVLHGRDDEIDNEEELSNIKTGYEPVSSPINHDIGIVDDMGIKKAAKLLIKSIIRRIKTKLTVNG